VSATSDGIIWSQHTESLFVWHSPVYCDDGWGGGRTGVWEFKPKERTWTYAAAHPGWWGAVSAVDPSTGNIVVATKNHAWEFDATARRYTRQSPRTRLITKGVPPSTRNAGSLSLSTTPSASEPSSSMATAWDPSR
jgi:hypothetical protein